MLRELAEVCLQEGLEFQEELLGNLYCKLCFNGKRVECKFLGKNLDKNDLYPCRYTEIKQFEALNN